MAVPTGEYGVDHNNRLCELVDHLVSVNVPKNCSGVYVPLSLERTGVRQAAGRLREDGFLTPLSELDSIMPLHFDYGQEPYTAKMSTVRWLEPPFRPTCSLVERAEDGGRLKLVNTPENKLGFCALSSGQALSGVGVFARREGSDTILGVRFHFNRKIYPQGYVLYTQDLFVIANPMRQSQLIEAAKCEVVFEKTPQADEIKVAADDDLEGFVSYAPPELEFDSLIFLDDQWPLDTENCAKWMTNLVLRDLCVPLD